MFSNNFTITSRFSFIGRTLDKDIDELTISILAAGWEILETQNLFIASGKTKLDLGLGKTLSEEGAKMVKNSTKTQGFTYTISRQDLKAVIKAGNIKFVAGGRSLEILIHASRRLIIYLSSEHSNKIRKSVVNYCNFPQITS